ncbi:MAG: tetraspanin family protein [Clostridium sp.]|nr:tetraspanin family protein [Clostridium sp.]MCM1399728.1 tetraspanin family protein [Clostridium sp.]MCM1460437.1 tetraspanin family protein [Bacteroides sp.]
MEDTVVMILFEQSTITILFAVLLVVFFIALVAMSIALFVSRGKQEDDYTEDDEKEIKKLGEVAKDEKAADIETIINEIEKETSRIKKEDVPGPMDDVFVNTLNEDNPMDGYTNTPSGDVDISTLPIDAMDDLYVNTLVEDEEQAEQQQSEDDIWEDGEYDEIGQTDKLIATDSQREFIESLKARDKSMASSAQEITNIDQISIQGNADAHMKENVIEQRDKDNEERAVYGQTLPGALTEEAIDASVKEADALRNAVMFGAAEQFAKATEPPRKKGLKRSNVLSTDDFYWYNKMDVAQKPSYKPAEMYYHYFNLPKDCIDDLLMEMYDCALVRTEEIKYIAYGIEPKAVSMREILMSGNAGYEEPQKKKEPTTQDLVKIYEKWCSYVDALFEKIELHADDYTAEEVKQRLYAFGKNDVEVLIEGK